MQYKMNLLNLLMISFCSTSFAMEKSEELSKKEISQDEKWQPRPIYINEFPKIATQEENAFFKAIDDNDFDTIHTLLKNNLDLANCFEYGVPALAKAQEKGNKTIINTIWMAQKMNLLLPKGLINFIANLRSEEPEKEEEKPFIRS